MTPVLENKSEARLSSPVSEQASPLPQFKRLLSAASFVSAPLVAVALLFGKPWTAASLVAGAAISLAVCGLLHLFVTRIMPFLVAGLNGRIDRNAGNGAVMQFAALIVVKFLVLGLIGYAIINFHEVSLPAVLVGFVLAQAAIIVTVSRHLNRH
jgi:hypothetical protein